jgi:aspartate racemase
MLFQSKLFRNKGDACMKTLGVIGGLGPAASAYFCQRLVELNPVSVDQEHPDVLIYSRASTPDRTAFLVGESEEDPFPSLLDTALRLQSMGAQVIAMPCATAHHFWYKLQSGLRVPLVHMLRKTAETLAEAGIRRAGLLATDGTRTSGEFAAELARTGIATVLPDPKDQETLMRFIYDVKAGIDPGAGVLRRLAGGLLNRGAECIILGCTELSLYNSQMQSRSGQYIDALDVLARASLNAVKEEVAVHAANPYS